MKKEVLEIRNLCLEHMDIVFYDLIKKGLIHPDSKFFSESRKFTWRTCFQVLYPLIEFFNGPLESSSDFFLHNSFLYTSAFFLDKTLDSLENNSSTRARASLIYTYLLIRYFEYLKSFKMDIVSLFFEYYKKQTHYLILEKKWLNPQHYISKYGSKKKIYRKSILLLFPLELCKKDLKRYNPLIIKKLFINYFSFILLADDLADLNFDITHRCLTYPVALYFKLKRKLPRDLKDMEPIIPQIIEILREFLKDIEKIETKIGKHSLIIDDTITRIKQELNKRGFEL